VGTRTWYDADEFLLDNVKAQRILEQNDASTAVTQINRYFDIDRLIHEEKWQLQRTADDGTYFPPIPQMRSYFGSDGHALWAAQYEEGVPFKFELFFYLGDPNSTQRKRMSLMLMYDATGRFDRLWQVRERDYRNHSPNPAWSDSLGIIKMGKHDLAQMWASLEDSYEYGQSYSGDVSGADLKQRPVPLITIRNAIGYMLPDGCMIMLPSQLDGTDFSAFARLGSVDTAKSTTLRAAWHRTLEHPTLTVTQITGHRDFDKRVFPGASS
jgi:hypothetical protein